MSRYKSAYKIGSRRRLHAALVRLSDTAALQATERDAIKRNRLVAEMALQREAILERVRKMVWRARTAQQRVDRDPAMVR